MSQWFDNAAAYARAGIPVFPVHGMCNGRCTCGEAHPAGQSGKHPLRGTRGHHDATTNLETLAAWSRTLNGAPCNIGAAIPDGWLVVDVDPRNGGAEALAAIERARGPLPADRVTLTGGSGLHIWLRTPTGLRWPRALAEGIDLKGPGGYIVAAGSTHETGAVYRWAPAPAGGTPRSPAGAAEAPAWITEQSYAAAVAPRAPSPDNGVDISAGDIAAITAELAPHCLHGQRHYLCWEIGSWLSGRGWSRDSICQVIAGLPVHESTESTAGAYKAAGDANGRAGGWSRIADRLGPERSAVVDQLAPNPERADAVAEIADSAALVASHEARLAETAGSAEDVYFGLGPPMSGEAPDPPERLVEGLDIAGGFTTLISGKPAAGKTPFALSLALALGSGAQWHGRRVTQCRVLYLTYEKARGCALKRARIARSMNVDPTCVEMLSVSQHPLTTPATIARIAAAVEIVGARPTVVMLDTYGAAVLGVSHNDAAFADPLRELSSKLADAGAAFMPLLHAKKGSTGSRDDIEGTGQLLAAADAVIGLTQNGEDHHVCTVSSLRPLDDGHAPFDIRWVNVEGGDDPRWGLGIAPPEQSAATTAISTQVKVTNEAAIDRATDKIRTWAAATPKPQYAIPHATLAAVTQATRAIADQAIRTAVRYSVVGTDGQVDGSLRYKLTNGTS